MELDVSRVRVNDDRGMSRVRVNNDRGVRLDHNVAAALVRSRVNIRYAPKYCDKHRGLATAADRAGTVPRENRSSAETAARLALSGAGGRAVRGAGVGAVAVL
jgi:hypothetical protein